MKLGFVSAILPELSLDEVLEFAATTGYECVEVMCWPPGKADRRYAGVTHIDVVSLDDAKAKEIRAAWDARGVEISALGYYPN
ncbi:MAG: sugar phosphate isomerase/epimerase, partial [Planctomycetales bacterium]|nr:sugar phosphate isomerase/epimerase [Planctomycetales bacterium]